MLETLKQWDRELFIFLNNLGTESFDSFWIFVTQIESWSALFVYFIVLLFYFYKGRQALWMLLFALLTFAVTITLTDYTKEFVARLRPNNVISLVDSIRVLQHPSSYSFFSGHAASSFSITTFIVLAIRPFSKWIYLAYVWPLLFIASRMYVGVHYPSDIVTGAIVGSSIALLLFWVLKKLMHKLS